MVLAGLGVVLAGVGAVAFRKQWVRVPLAVLPGVAVCAVAFGLQASGSLSQTTLVPFPGLFATGGVVVPVAVWTLLWIADVG